MGTAGAEGLSLSDHSWSSSLVLFSTDMEAQSTKGLFLVSRRTRTPDPSQLLKTEKINRSCAIETIYTYLLSHVSTRRGQAKDVCFQEMTDPEATNAFRSPGIRAGNELANGWGVGINMWAAHFHGYRFLSFVFTGLLRGVRAPNLIGHLCFISCVSLGL